MTQLEKINFCISELVKNYVPEKHSKTPDLLYKYFRNLPIYYDASQFHYKSENLTLFKDKDNLIIFVYNSPSPLQLPFTKLKSIITHYFETLPKPVNKCCQYSIFDFITDIN